MSRYLKEVDKSHYDWGRARDRRGVGCLPLYGTRSSGGSRFRVRMLLKPPLLSVETVPLMQ